MNRYALAALAAVVAVSAFGAIAVMSSEEADAALQTRTVSAQVGTSFSFSTGYSGANGDAPGFSPSPGQSVWNLYGSLPSGLSFNHSQGSVAGVPTSAQTRTVELLLTQDGVEIYDMSLTIVVSSAPPTQNTFKIAYNLNGGSGSVPMSTFTDSSSTYYGAVTGTVPSREGYVFLGWWTSPGGNSFGSYSHAGDSVYFSAPGTITLYAIWQVPKWDFVIHYDANGGSGAPPDSVFADRTDPRYVAALSASVPSWAGRNFAGWALTASGEDGSGASTIIAGNCYEFDAPAVTEVTVFAQWLSAVEGGAALWFIGDSFEFEARPGQAFEKTFITNVPAEITMESPHAWLQLSGGRLFGTAPADGAETAYELILHATAGPNHCERVVKVIVKPDGEGAAAGNAALILILIGAMFCAVVFWPKKRGRR